MQGRENILLCMIFFLLDNKILVSEYLIDTILQRNLYNVLYSKHKQNDCFFVNSTFYLKVQYHLNLVGMRHFDDLNISISHNIFS